MAPAFDMRVRITEALGQTPVRRISITAVVLCFCITGCITGRSVATDSAVASRQEELQVVPFTAPKLAPRPASAEVVKIVEDLIDSLKEISKPDFGLSPTLDGADFPPVPDAAETASLLFTDHNLQRSDAVTRLVELGPAALPSLLKHLTDNTPTKLVITHEGGFGGMWYAQELPCNPASEQETNTLQAAGLRGPNSSSGLSLPDVGNEEKIIREHTVTVGDVCFLIIGMISNRSYQSVRYQPTACIVINSPIKRPELAKAVRAIWTSEDLRESLYRHLLLDYHTRGPNEGLQCGAAMRLLYYFPAETALLVTERLRSFTFKDNDDWQARFKRNGVHAPSFIKAVAWNDNPALRQAIQKLVLESTEADIVVSGIPAMAGAATDFFYEKLRGMLSKANKGYGYPSTDPQGLLKGIAALYPERTAEALRIYLAQGGRESRINIVSFMASTHIDLAPEILKPILEDRSDGLGSYLIEGDMKKERYKESDYLPMRMCDNAYVLICRALGDKDAVCTGTAEEMDTRIASLDKRLAAGSKNATFTPEEIRVRVQDRQKAELARQDELQRDGEQAYLLKHALPTDKSETWPDEKMLKTIANKYPQSLPMLYVNLLRDCPHLQSHPVIDLLVRSKLPRDAKIEVLLEGAKHKKLEHRRAALFALHDLKYDGFVDLLIDALKSLPKTPDVPYWESKAGPFAILVAQSNDPKAWKALGEEARRVDTGMRMEMLNIMDYGNVMSEPLEPRMAFLAGFLEDASVRVMSEKRHLDAAESGLKGSSNNLSKETLKSSLEPYEGPCAGFTFPRLEVRDLAAMELGLLLKTGTEPEPSWTPAQWADFRAKVRKALNEKQGRKGTGP